MTSTTSPSVPYVVRAQENFAVERRRSNTTGRDLILYLPVTYEHLGTSDDPSGPRTAASAWTALTGRCGCCPEESAKAYLKPERRFNRSNATSTRTIISSPSCQPFLRLLIWHVPRESEEFPRGTASAAPNQDFVFSPTSSLLLFFPKPAAYISWPGHGYFESLALCARPRPPALAPPR